MSMFTTRQVPGGHAAAGHAHAGAHPSSPGRAGLARRPWTVWAFWVLIALSAVVYFCDLSVNGYANDFYAAATKSGTESWTALLFGSVDAAGSITVDKPPAAIWLMALSGRLFGFSSWSLLAPQALLGVGTVALTHATVKRWAGQVAGLLAGLIVLVTPVAALMFRFDNPDALLTFTMVAAAYCLARAVDSEHRALRWMLGCGALIGLAFLTKLMQGLLVLPAFALVYLLASPTSVSTRIRHLLGGLVSFLVSAGWYVALVSLWPAADRPYIGGSTNNSLWQLALGYDGLGRIFGATSTSSSGSARQGGNFAGTAGILRLFQSQFGTEISWLLPSSLLLLLAGLVARGRAPRSDRLRAGLLLWGGWTVITGAVFSFMQGTVHPYYSVAMAPGIAATIAFGATAVWRKQHKFAWRLILPISSLAAAGWGAYLLHRDASSWHPWLGWVAVALALVGAVLALLPNRSRRLTTTGLAVGLAGALLAPLVWTAATLGVAHTDSNPTAGPANVLTSSMRGGAGQGQGHGPVGSTASSTGAPSGESSTSSSSSPSSSSSSSGSTGSTGSTSAQGQTGGEGNTANAAVVALLNSTTTEWSAATIGAQSADPYILASHTSVMPIGGFAGDDVSPTLAQFEAYVTQGKIHYFITGGSAHGAQSNSIASQITAWVTSHYKSTTVGGVTVYDLTQPTS